MRRDVLRGDLLARVPVLEDLGARDRLERAPDLREAHVDHVLVAPEAEAHRPAAEAELAADALVDLVGQRVLAVVPLRARGHLRRDAHPAADRRHALQDVLELEVAHDVDRGPDVLGAPQPEHERRVHLGPGHEVDAHAGDDPVVGLDEERVEHRAEPALVQVPGRVAILGADAGAQERAVGEDDLHAAGRREVLAVREVGDPVVERVADDAPPPEIGDGEHERVTARLQRVVEVEPAHAGLDDGVAELLVDLEDAVHVAQADRHRAADARRGPAVAVVAPGRVRPHRDRVAVGDPHDLLDLLGRLRHHDDRGRVRVVVRGPERIAELADRGVLRDHGLVAQRGAELLQRGVERPLGQA